MQVKYVSVCVRVVFVFITTFKIIVLPNFNPFFIRLQINSINNFNSWTVSMNTKSILVKRKAEKSIFHVCFDGFYMSTPIQEARVNVRLYWLKPKWNENNCCDLWTTEKTKRKKLIHSDSWCLNEHDTNHVSPLIFKSPMSSTANILKLHT